MYLYRESRFEKKNVVYIYGAKKNVLSKLGHIYVIDDFWIISTFFCLTQHSHSTIQYTNRLNETLHTGIHKSKEVENLVKLEIKNSVLEWQVFVWTAEKVR